MATETQKASRDNCLVPMSSEFFGYARDEVVKKNGQLITPDRDQFQQSNEERQSFSSQACSKICNVEG